MVYVSGRIESRKAMYGFTLIELLVVISIIALLMSILMPALSRVRAIAKQTVCLAHMRQVGLASVLYAQENNDHIVAGRFHNHGDWLSLNSFYSNLTPYLDPGKPANSRVWDMTRTDAAKYNAIWEELICPAVKKSDIGRTSFFQGVSIRTLGMNIAVGWLADNGYIDGYGTRDWATGKTRKMSNIGNASGMMAFCDTLNTEYLYSGGYQHLKDRGYDPDKYIPVRHPGGYSVTFVDGHGDMVKEEIIRGDPHERIWRIK